MKPDLNTRKPIEELTEEDLATFPLWEYVLDEEDYDETYVRPLDAETLPRESYSISVAARYWLKSGAEYLGTVMVTTGTETIEILPAFIFVGGKAMSLPNPLSGTPDVGLGIDLVRENLPKRMRLPMDQILPAKYQLLVRLEGEANPREGIAS